MIFSINEVLSSAVVAAIVTAVFSLIIRDKDSFNEHVTGERAEWRRVIREIASALPSENVLVVNDIIRKLEPYINPYGKYSDRFDVMADSHIWDLIEKIKTTIASEAEKSLLNEQTELLKEYLCSLLKYDWDRSKREVRATWERRWAVAFGIGIAAILIMMQLNLPGRTPDFTDVIIVLSFPIIAGMINSVDIEDRKIKILSVIFYIIAIANILAVFWKYYKASEYAVDFLNVWISPLVYLMVGLVFFVVSIMRNNIERKYRKELNKIIPIEKKCVDGQTEDVSKSGE